MNTKHILFAIATLVLLFAVSCQRDELQGGFISGEEVSVSISAVMPDGGSAVVKSDTEPGNGSFANRCIMQIYYLPDRESGSADPIPYGDRVTVAVSGMKALFPDQRLVSGHDYRFVFWADHVTDNSSAEALAQDLHYDTEEFPIVSFKEEEDGTLSYSSNDDTRDAFFAAEVRNISGPSSLSFDLKRPFGQLNIITTDWGVIPGDVVDQLRPSNVRLDFKSLPNSIDLVSGKVTGSVNISSEVVPVSRVPENGDSKQLSFDYIFAKDGEQTVLADFTMDFLLADGTTQVTDEAYTFTNIPVQRNYQTNVRGNLLTDRTGVEIEVIPEFYTPAIEISTEEELVGILTNGGNAVLTGDVTVSSQYLTLEEGENALLDLADHTITFDANGTALTATGASVTFKNGTIIADKIEKVNVSAMTLGENGSMELDGITMVTNGTGPSIPQGAHGSRLTIRNSNIAAPSAYAVSTNASVATQDVVITLENSEFSGSTPVFINIPCTLNMSGCTVNATMHGLVIRGGTATVKDCHITMTYPEDETQDDAESMADYFDNRNWGTGNTINLAAIVVGNKVDANSPSYKYTSVLSIENSTIETTGIYAGLFPALYVWANQEAENGVTITYDSNTKFYGARTYGNDGANTTVNGSAPVSDGGDTRPTE